MDDKPATITVFEHENAMMHKDKDCERMKNIVVAVCVSFVLITIIFVTGYTIRTRIWLDTILQLQARAPVTLAEEFQMSDRQIKNIVYRCEKILFSHLPKPG